ncbi:hypothetical protein FOE78_04675 [Microlunatus elymi]|uniref:Uncharacterized protein n=1 Tax=Microlunatus elymi TaxID=2596828 RepID=A0A516PVS9_9ACTN|nr:hypothetical protein [Microlunatus elymi]QDP95298.1 hypothetical protein FOE78_04675 [Microlunatus elymi]
MITGIDDGGAEILSLHHEIELIKASLLYADSVEVLSLGNQMVRQFSDFAAGDPRNLLALIGSLDDDQLRSMDPRLDPSQLREVLPILFADPSDIRAAIGFGDPDVNSFLGVLEGVQGTTSEAMSEIRTIVSGIRDSSGLSDLDRAIDRKLLRFNDRVELEGDNMLDQFASELKKYLMDPTRFLLLDATVASLIQSMISEGLVTPPQRTIGNAGEAVIGTGFIARLPAFPTAHVDEVVDLRSDLQDPLTRYRSKVAKLRGELQTGPFDEHIQAEIDALWRPDVDPALADLRQAMADHGLVRDMVRAAGGDLGSFALGRWAPAAVSVIAANTFDLGTAVAAGITGAAAMAPSVARGLISHGSSQRAAKTGDLYYLYALDRALDRAQV